jgi:hypothetical protein
MSAKYDPYKEIPVTFGQLKKWTSAHAKAVRGVWFEAPVRFKEPPPGYRQLAQYCTDHGCNIQDGRTLEWLTTKYALAQGISDQEVDDATIQEMVNVLMTPRRPKHQAREAPTSRGERRMRWVAEALMLVHAHPDWSDAKIARRVGIDKSQLSRCEEYRRARVVLKGDVPSGHAETDADTNSRRGVEAYSLDDASTETEWDDE